MKSIMAGFVLLLFAQVSYGQACFKTTKVATFNSSLELETLKSVCLESLTQEFDRFGRLNIATQMTVNGEAMTKSAVVTKVERVDAATNVLTFNYELHQKGYFCSEQVANILTIKAVFKAGEFSHLAKISADAFYTWDNCHDTSPTYEDLGLAVAL